MEVKTTVTLTEIVKEALQNAEENGFPQWNLSPYQVADDLWLRGDIPEYASIDELKIIVKDLQDAKRHEV